MYPIKLELFAAVHSPPLIPQLSLINNVGALTPQKIGPKKGLQYIASLSFFISYVLL